MGQFGFLFLDNCLLTDGFILVDVQIIDMDLQRGDHGESTLQVVC